MNRRIISCAAAVVAAILAATASGCGGDSATDKAGGSGNPMTLRLATPDRQGMPGTKAIEHFGDEVAKLSDGAITIKPVYEAAGDAPHFDQAVADLVRTGRAEMALIPARAWDEYGMTSLSALQAPFLIHSNAVLGKVVSGELADPMLQSLPGGVTGLALLPENLRHPFGFVHPLVSLRDFAGVKIRAPRSEATYELLRTLGAEPVDLSGDDLADGIKDGSVEAAESAFEIAGSTLHDKYGTGTSNITFFPKVNTLVANTEALEQLTDEQHATLETAAERTRDWVLETMPSEQDAAQAYCRQGGRVTAASPADVRAIEAAAQPSYAQLEQDPKTREMLARIRAVAATAEPAEDDAPTCDRSAGDVAAPTGGAGSGIPNGTYRNEITVDEMIAAGVDEASARDNAGIHTITLTDGKIHDTGISDVTGVEEPGSACDATYSVSGDEFTFTWSPETGCVGDFTATWSMSGGGLHLGDVSCADDQCGLVDRVLWGLKPFRKIG
jgi:TRAP-type C4-dicarboxylate transport system substrate-binding protein